MKSTDHKKIFRADTEQENKKQLNQSEKRKIIAVCAAVAAIAVIFSGVGIGYSVRRASEENSLCFSEMEDSVKGQMQEEMRSAAVYLEKLDESISGNREKLNEVNERLTQREQALLESEKVQKQLEKNSSGMTERVTQLEKTTHTKVNEIQTDMESVHAEIQASLEQISKVIASLEEQKEQDGKDHDQSITEINRVNQSVQEINQSVENIENKLNSSYDGIKGLIEKLQAEETKNQEALKKDHQLLVQSLTDVEGNLKIILETDMTQISQAFSDLTTSFQAKVDQLGSLLETRMDQMDANLGGLGEDISGLDQNISGLGTDISGLNQNISGLGQNISGLDQNISQNLGGVAEKLGELNRGVNNSLTLLEQNFAKHMNELSQISGEGTGALKTYLGELSEALKQDLNQVFISVSNGKTGLASALLTKGVSAENDATFAELKDAVLRIPQKLVIGVEEVPGTITYHYHYHVDGAGENPHTETNPQQGGCYTVPKYHVHSEAAGCYTIRKYHKHNDSCPGHPVWVDWVPNQEPYWGWIYECNDQPINASEKVLNCSKSTSAIDCYNTSCGWVDGQIIGAEIVYDKEAAKQRAEAAAKGEPPLAEEALPEESIEQEYPEGGLPFAPPEIADQLEPPKPEVETQPENETKPESGTQPESETTSENETEPEGETQPESETEPESETPSENGTKPEGATQPESETEPESESQPENEIKPENETSWEVETQPESETYAEAA